jgi:acetylornithine deacetylase/succinyl-diaminopimelate desuccinylase-like protein
VSTRSERWLTELCQLLEFPSISADPRHWSDVNACANWLARHIQAIGLENVRVLPGPNGGLPSVYADWLHAPRQPVLLLYGHFDVQPARAGDGWATRPFQPTRIGDRLYARGASDDKGQLFAHLKAIETWMSDSASPPVNVKVWLEGEEEINSPNLPAFLEREHRRLEADAALVSDTFMPSPDQPAIVLALRGNVTFQLNVRGAPADVHSGRYGGAVANPLEALCRVVAGLHDSQGRVNLPGFYARVRTWSPAARKWIRSQHLSDAAFLRSIGVESSSGEYGYSAIERATIRPSLAVTGINGGHVRGDTSVIPARAAARMSARLVADQDPYEISRLVSQHLVRLKPPTTTLGVRTTGLSYPVEMSAEHPVFGAVERAVKRVWGVHPRYTRSGGSIAAVAQLHRRLGMPIVVLGMGLPSDAIHAPNEHLNISQFFKGIDTVVRFLGELRR